MRSRGLLLLAIAATAQFSVRAEEPPAAWVEAPGLRTGLWVLIEPRDAAMGTALAGKNLVHALYADAAELDTHREAWALAGELGTVSGERWSGGRLPYADRLVNALVCEDFPAAAKRNLTVPEIVRVLAPLGSAFLKGLDADAVRAAAPSEEGLKIERFGSWVRIERARPAAMDDWMQPYKDGARSNRSRDAMAGIPEQVRWIADRHFAGSYGRTASGFTTANGYALYMNRPEAADGLGKEAGGVLTCRDAYNGLLRWRRVISHPQRAWHWAMPGAICDLERVYVPLAQNVLAIDLASGKDVWTAPSEGGWTETLLSSNGLLLRLAPKKFIQAIRTKDGSPAWKIPAPQGEVDFAIGDGKVFVWSGHFAGGKPNTLAAYDLADAKPLWSVTPQIPEHPNPIARLSLLQYLDGAVIVKVGRKTGNAVAFLVYSASDGTYRFASEGGGLGTLTSDGKRLWNGLTGFDPQTGAVTEQIKQGGKYRGTCGQSLTNDKVIVAGRLGYIERETGKVSGYTFSRAACSFGGVYLVNGLSYFVRHQCTCASMIRGEMAIATSAPGFNDEPTPEDRRLETGPAYGKVEAQALQPGDWPTYRGNAMRGGMSEADLPETLAPEWDAPVGKHATAPSAGYGLVCVADPEAHRVIALDAASGKARWTFTAGGPVDSPPTFAEGYAIFGCTDGWVYALDARDGRLAWRYLAALNERKIVVRERVQSAWPVAGSVLVENGIVYATAGHHGNLDGGLRYLALNVQTGKPVWQRTALGAGSSGDKHTWPLTNGIPCSDGQHVYLTGLGGTWDGCQMKYGFDLAEGKPAPQLFNEQNKQPKGPILAAEGGLLVDVRDRAAASDYHTESRRIWYYHPNQTGYQYPHSSNEKSAFQLGAAHGYVGDLLVFRPGEVYGAWRTFASKHRTLGIFGHPKADEQVWQHDPQRWYGTLRALIGAGSRLYVAYDTFPKADGGGVLRIHSTADGAQLAEMVLPAAVRWDGMAAANGRLYLATEDGRVLCLAAKP
ncbi:MAG: PQQ-binding-like beta-propeller repeat protein [Planctomycetes bacterium]|nr:PQQ-binding-like beta-propeller repeat protein [Planctomycetota bacterium]